MQGLTELVGASFWGAPIGVSGVGPVPLLTADQPLLWLLPQLAQTQPVDASALAIKVVVVLGLTAGLLLVVTHFLKKMGYGTGTPAAASATNPKRQRGRAAGSPAPAITIEHVMPITRQAKVATITVDGHRLVVGITDQQVNLLKDLSVNDPSAQPSAEPERAMEPVTGELERYPIDPAIIRAAQLRSRRDDRA